MSDVLSDNKKSPPTSKGSNVLEEEVFVSSDFENEVDGPDMYDVILTRGICDMMKVEHPRDVYEIVQSYVDEIKHKSDIEFYVNLIIRFYQEVQFDRKQRYATPPTRDFWQGVFDTIIKTIKDVELRSASSLVQDDPNWGFQTFYLIEI